MSPSLVSLADAVASIERDDVLVVNASQRKERLTELRHAIDRLEVAFDATVAASDTAGDGQVLDGATSTAAWLRHALRLAPRDASAHVHTARALSRNEAADPAVEAVREGSISYGHLRAITGTLDDLAELDQASGRAHGIGAPATTPSHHVEAVTLLVDLAGQVDPAQLRSASRHLRYVLDPERGKADYERQSQTRRASLAPLLDGTWRLEVLTTAEGGALLRQLLTATGSPTSSDDSRTATQRRHDALLDALQVATQSDQLPVSGALSPRILITTPPEAFLPDKLRPGSSPAWRPATFADGGPIPGPLFDQLSCNPTLIRVIQSPSGVVLDVGRAHRFFTPGQRTALWTRDRGCRFPGCSAPWTHAHHVLPWQQGGTTDLANGLLLCSHHHRAVHDGTWSLTTGQHGANHAVTFTHRNRLTVHHSPLPPPDPLIRE
ncbi:MAG: DUF222 domain-containing protein [Actinomycetes bacterium]